MHTMIQTVKHDSIPVETEEHREVKSNNVREYLWPRSARCPLAIASVVKPHSVPHERNHFHNQYNHHILDRAHVWDKQAPFDTYNSWPPFAPIERVRDVSMRKKIMSLKMQTLWAGGLRERAKISTTCQFDTYFASVSTFLSFLIVPVQWVQTPDNGFENSELDFS